MPNVETENSRQGCPPGDMLSLARRGAEQAAWARQQQYALLAALRPDAVALVDAFGIEDYLLNSALGRADGDVYRALLLAARASPLNATQARWQGGGRVCRVGVWFKSMESFVGSSAGLVHGRWWLASCGVHAALNAMINLVHVAWPVACKA